MQDIDENSDLRKNTEFFNRNGYCVILKSDLHIQKFTEIIDLLLEKESWRGGWEGKEEYMKHGKNFQPGAHRLGNLFNKHEFFRELLINEDILKTSLAILGDDVKIGGLDMREPKRDTGQQDLHMDWIRSFIGQWQRGIRQVGLRAVSSIQ